MKEKGRKVNRFESVMTMPRSMRDLVLCVARSEVSPRILEQMREMVRADITRQDR